MKRFTPVVLILLVNVSGASAEELADPNQIRPLKTFAPPPSIPPNGAQRYQVENQFDRTDRAAYFSVTDNINNGMSPLKISSDFYGKNFYNSLLSGIREANYYAIANLNHTKANNYKDGNGNRVRRGYERFNQALILGYVPNERQEYRLTFIHDKIDDDEQPQHQTEAVETDRTISRVSICVRGGKI